MSFCRAGFRKDRNVRSATSAAHRVPRQCWPKPEGLLDCQHCHRPKGSLAHTPHSSQRAASPRVYFATMVLLDQRPLPHDRRVRRASLLDAPSKPASHGVHKTLSLRAAHLRRTPQRLHCDTVGEMTLYGYI